MGKSDVKLQTSVWAKPAYRTRPRLDFAALWDVRLPAPFPSPPLPQVVTPPRAATSSLGQVVMFQQTDMFTQHVQTGTAHLCGEWLLGREP